MFHSIFKLQNFCWKLTPRATKRNVLGSIPVNFILVELHMSLIWLMRCSIPTPNWRYSNCDRWIAVLDADLNATEFPATPSKPGEETAAQKAYLHMYKFIFAECAETQK
jgi:hypothetical protein